MYDPHVLFIQETWLNKSIEMIKITNYVLLSRRDRSDEDNRGGIIAYVRSDVHNVVHLFNSSEAERSWHLIHTDVGTYAMANWYRPGVAEENVLQTFRQELEEIVSQNLGTLVTGDLNIHHSKWLVHSSGNTPQGEMLREIANDFGLVQLVREPTREQYLLDLCMSDIHGCKIRVLPRIADHKALLITLQYEEPAVIEVPRKVWHFRGAAWQNLRCALTNHSWQALHEGTPNDAVNHFSATLLSLCEKFIPQSTILIRKQTHPWIDASCEEAVARKNAAESSDQYAQARDECAQVLHQAYRDYLADLKARIAALPKGSKRWWALNRELLEKKAKMSNIPPLRVGIDWVLDAPGKANALADTWTRKCVLPDIVEDQFVPAPEHRMSSFIAIRTRQVEKQLSCLDENKATGPDRMSACILRKLASVLALPLAIICRRLLYEGAWPEIWKVHYLVAIYKRGVVHNPGNYRGVHLTSILSKVVERVIGSPLIAYLQEKGYGLNQWAYRKRCSSRDMALMCITSCVLAICQGYKMGVYLGDISGAFDRVCKDYMIAKLYSIGVPDFFLDFLNAYLSPRIGYVCIAGALSEAFELANMVFQGTVLGPTLWNCFFSDVALAMAGTGCEEKLFADDISAYKKFRLSICNDDVRADMAKAKHEVHQWGKRNRVSFDASKEHVVILHPSHGEGDDFRLVGTLVDAKLSMQPAVQDILDKVHPKTKAILRTRGLYNHADMIRQYKTHIWSLIEYHNGVIQHACASQLQRIDAAQRGYLRELHLTEESGFVVYNFAPPSLRRDIGLLGFLHKRTLEQCHPAIIAFFGRAPHVQPWHDKQLQTYLAQCTHQRGLYERSIFNIVHVYNRLPQEVVDIASVSNFQACLTAMAKRKCDVGARNWRQIFRTPLAYVLS